MRELKIGDKFGEFVISGERFKKGKTYHIEVTCKCNTKSIKYCDKLVKLTCCRKCSSQKRKKFNIGEKVGNFTIIGYRHTYKSNTNNNILVRCDCGYEYYSNTYNLKYVKVCQFCAEKRVGLNHSSYKGLKYVSKTQICQIKSSAARRKLDYDLDIDYLDDLLQKQNHKCIYSGVYLCSGNSKREQTASLDRIDSSKGYIKGNVQWVHKDINRLKTNFSHEKFLELITLIYQNINL